MSEEPTVIQSCYINGKTCRNGKRDDFDVNPLTGEKVRCNKWIKLMGTDPQSGAHLEEWHCSEFWKIKLALENAQMVRQNTASTDKVANQIQRQRAEFYAALTDEARDSVRAGTPQITEQPNGTS